MGNKPLLIYANNATPPIRIAIAKITGKTLRIVEVVPVMFASLIADVIVGITAVTPIKTATFTPINP